MTGVAPIPAPDDGPTRLRTWRAPRWGRVAFTVFIGVTGYAAVAIPVIAGVTRSSAEFAVCMLVIMAMCVAFTYGTAVTLTPDSLIVTTAFRKTVIPLSEIANVTVRDIGLVIRTRDGRTRTAWAVPKDDFSRLLGRRTRADEVADVIRVAAGLRVPRPLGYRPPQTAPPPAWPTSAGQAGRTGRRGRAGERRHRRPPDPG